MWRNRTKEQAAHFKKMRNFWAKKLNLTIKTAENPSGFLEKMHLFLYRAATAVFLHNETSGHHTEHAEGDSDHVR